MYIFSTQIVMMVRDRFASKASKKCWQPKMEQILHLYTLVEKKMN
jgi:hypothetical protein